MITWVSFEKLMSDWNQTWIKDGIGVTLYVYEVKGNVPMSKVISEVKLGRKCTIFIFVEVQMQ